MRRVVARVTRRLVLVPLLYIGWRLVVLGRKMGIGASLPDRVIRAIDFNDVKALDDVCPAATAAPAVACALARSAAFGLTSAGAARADAGGLPAAGRAAAAGDAGHGSRPPAVVAAHVRGRQRLVRLRRRGALPGHRQALAALASWGGRERLCQHGVFPTKAGGARVSRCYTYCAVPTYCVCVEHSSNSCLPCNCKRSVCHAARPSGRLVHARRRATLHDACQPVQFPEADPTARSHRLLCSRRVQTATRARPPAHAGRRCLRPTAL